MFLVALHSLYEDISLYKGRSDVKLDTVIYDDRQLKKTAKAIRQHDNVMW